MALTTAQLAERLIGTKNLPAGLSRVSQLASEAWAYHCLDPYPTYAFRNWKTEELGPIPICYPIAKSMVQRGAKWLFGKPVQIQCQENETFEKFLRDAWEQNRMPSRLVAMAEKAALEGGIALKFSYDEENGDRPLSIQTLSLVSEVRLYYHPHDRDQLLMARIQYPYFDHQEGATYWYREEWTADKLYIYLPVKSDQFKGQVNPDTYEGWIVATRENNPFGVIPVIHIKNLETDGIWGRGDLWDLYRIVDRGNVDLHLWDRKDQLDAYVNPIYIDLQLGDADIDSPVRPGQPISAESSDRDTGKQGKVEFPPDGNGAQEAIKEHFHQVMRQLYSAASSVEVNQEEITNKGNLTKQVLEQIYQPLIEITSEKRKTYGHDGMVRFFSLIARGLKNAGVKLGITDEVKSHKCDLMWTDFFELTEEEKMAVVTRVQEEEAAGYAPHERVVREVTIMEGRGDVEAILRELKKDNPGPIGENQQLQLEAQRAALAAPANGKKG